jgi:hypothetical protein
MRTVIIVRLDINFTHNPYYSLSDCDQDSGTASLRSRTGNQTIPSVSGIDVKISSAAAVVLLVS